MRRLVSSLLIGAFACVAFPSRTPSYCVSVEVNGCSRAAITVPAGDIVGINYDVKNGGLNLFSVKPIDLHPSRTYQKLNTQFFTPLQCGTYRLSWRSGACKCIVVVKE